MASDDAYEQAFPDAMSGMGCPTGACAGYELVANLDFDTNGDGQVGDGDAYWNDGAGWEPMGNWQHPFDAVFDGGRHTISNLYIHRSEKQYVGLFGSIGSDGAVSRVGLLYVSATVSASPSATGQTLVGSLAGDNRGSVTYAYATGRAFASGGYCLERRSNNFCHKSRPDAVGGMVGRNSGIVIASYAGVNVSGGVYSDIGGLVGSNSRDAAIVASYATGKVTATGSANDDGYQRISLGGLAGQNSNQVGTIIASYSTGSVLDDASLESGGLVGENLDYKDAANPGAIAADSYWDIGTSGLSRSAGGTGKTTAELQAPTGYTEIYAGWNVDVDNADGDNDPATGGDAPWDFGTSSEYPRLKGVGPSNATEPVAAPLGNPANLQATPAGSGQVGLTWEPASNADAQRISWYRIESDGAETFIDGLEVSGSASSATVAGLEDGQTYEFEVTGSREVAGEVQWSQPSNRARVTLPEPQSGAALTAPTNVRAVSNAAGELALIWEGGDNADSYVLIAVHMGTFDYETTSVAGDAARSGTIAGLVEGVSYLGIVVALQVQGDGSLETLYGSAPPVTVQ